jgi:protein TonB
MDELKITFMRNIFINNKLTKFFVMAAFSMGTLAACTDNAGDKTSDRNPATTDTAAAAGGSSTSSYDAKNKDAAGSSGAGATAAGKKKGKASVAMSENNNNDKMVMDKEGVYNKATIMPQFPGGQDALASYVNNHVEYPQQAIDDNKTGTVRVSFVVDENGKVTNARLINDRGDKVGNGLDEEALRVINNMPAWKPGKVKGKTVKTRLELPINFQLEA